MEEVAPAPVAPVLALAGPTASGKSAAVLALAETHPVEVVTVDAFQVYRGMDVGTAKPSREERARVPHHLLDLCDPVAAYSAARFLADAEAAVGRIRARGRIPILVGGTMLYLHALVRGLFAAPPPEADLRAALSGLPRPELLARLADEDPDAAAELSDAPSRRIARAIEIARAHGSLAGARAATRPAPFPVEIHAIAPAPPAARAAVSERTAAIFSNGLLAEVETLRSAGVLPEHPSQRAIGYREAHAVLEGRLSEGVAREAVATATRRLAKRQRTWLRNTLRAAATYETAEKAREGLARRLDAGLP